MSDLKLTSGDYTLQILGCRGRYGKKFPKDYVITIEAEIYSGPFSGEIILVRCPIRHHNEWVMKEGQKQMDRLIRALGASRSAFRSNDDQINRGILGELITSVFSATINFDHKTLNLYKQVVLTNIDKKSISTGEI